MPCTAQCSCDTMRSRAASQSRAVALPGPSCFLLLHRWSVLPVASLCIAEAVFLPRRPWMIVMESAPTRKWPLETASLAHIAWQD